MPSVDYESAFEEALAIVATSNTVTFLRNRLSVHPLVQYLADRFTLREIEEKLIEEVHSFDRTLQKATIAILLLLALIKKLEGTPIQRAVKNALEASEIRWVKELLSLYRPGSDSATQFSAGNITHTVSKRRINSIQTDSGRVVFTA